MLSSSSSAAAAVTETYAQGSAVPGTVHLHPHLHPPPCRIPPPSDPHPTTTPLPHPKQQIRFVLLLSRQGKVRLAKWYTTQTQKERARALKEVAPLVLGRPPKLCNFVDWRDQKLVYKRYASLYFVAGVDTGARRPGGRGRGAWRGGGARLLLWSRWRRGLLAWPRPCFVATCRRWGGRGGVFC